MSLPFLHPFANLSLICQTVSLCRPCPMSMEMTTEALVAPLNVFNQHAPCMCCGDFPLYDKGFRRSVCSANTHIANVARFLYGEWVIVCVYMHEHKIMITVA